MANYLSPGISISTVDIPFPSLNTVSSSICAAAFFSNKGPIEPFLITRGINEFIDLYGSPNPEVSYAHDSIVGLLNQVNVPVWCKRVVNGAAYGGLFLYSTNQATPSSGESIRYKFPTGTTLDYDSGGSRQITGLRLSAALVSLDSIDGTIDDGVTSQTITATAFATSSNATWEALRVKIQTALDALATGGVALILDGGSGTDDDRVMTIMSPQGKVLNITLTLTNGGAGTATLGKYSDPKLLEVFAENPGDWSDQLGIKVTNIDTGTQTRLKLTFSAALVTSNVINLNVNTTAISPVTFATDSNTTMAAIASAIQTAMTTEFGSGGTVTVVAATGISVSNNREILIVAPQAEAFLTKTLTISGVAVTAGASQATSVVSTVVTGEKSDNTFNLEVYLGTELVETFVDVSLREQSGPDGSQQNISYRVNESGEKSKYIRVAQSSWSKTTGRILTTDSNIVTLDGGDNGSQPTNAQLIDGWDVFKDKDTYNIGYLLNCGYTHVQVQQKLDSLAQLRRDCIAILDVPSDVQSTATALVNYVGENLNITSRFSAMYAPDIKISDPYTELVRFVPPCGYIAASFVRTDNQFGVWRSNAGYTNGVLSNIIGLRFDYDEASRNILSPKGINAIIRDRTRGQIVVYDDRTRYQKNSFFRAVHISKLSNYLEKTLQESLKDYLFNPNDDFTRTQIVTTIQTILDFLIRERAIKNDAGVISNDSNNSATEIDQGIRRVDIYFTPIESLRNIVIKSILRPSGVSIEQILEAA